MNLIQSIRSFIRDEDGAAAIEYGLIAALIAIAIIVGATLLGTSLNGLFYPPRQLHGHADRRRLRAGRLSTKARTRPGPSLAG